MLLQFRQFSPQHPCQQHCLSSAEPTYGLSVFLQLVGGPLTLLARYIRKGKLVSIPSTHPHQVDFAHADNNVSRMTTGIS